MKPSKLKRKKLRAIKHARELEKAYHVDAFVRLDKAIEARGKRTTKKQ